MLFAKIMHADPRDGSYIIPFEDVCNTIDAEMDGINVGDKIVIEIIEMDEDVFNHLEEFMGW